MVFVGSVVWWFGGSVVQMFGGPVAWWFGDLVVRWFGGSVLWWFAGLVVRRLRWYGVSVPEMLVLFVLDVSPTKRAPSSHGAFMARFGSPSVAPTRQKSLRGPLCSIQCGWQHVRADRFEGQRADEH